MSKIYDYNSRDKFNPRAYSPRCIAGCAPAAPVIPFLVPKKAKAGEQVPLLNGYKMEGKCPKDALSIKTYLNAAAVYDEALEQIKNSRFKPCNESPEEFARKAIKDLNKTMTDSQFFRYGIYREADANKNGCISLSEAKALAYSKRGALEQELKKYAEKELTPERQAERQVHIKALEEKVDEARAQQSGVAQETATAMAEFPSTWVGLVALLALALSYYPVRRWART